MQIVVTTVQTLQKTAPVLRFVFVLLVTPFLFLWKIIFKPLTLVLYKIYIIVRQRLGQYFHAQHKLLAIITHRFALHTLVIILTMGIITTNITQAREVQAQEFAEGSLVAKIFRPEEDTIITAETIMPTQYNYIDTSTSVKITPQINGELPTASEAMMVTAGGSTLVKSNTLVDAKNQRANIVRYQVQSGDTVSTIAEQFGVTTKTILWSNNLSAASLIKPGDELFILPTSGVAHTVKSGETVSSIAQKYNAPAEDILEFNDLITGEDLLAGAEIIIPGGIQPAPPAPVPPTRLASIRDVFSGGSGTPAPNAPAATGSMNWPTNCSRISQYFTWRHTGIDIDCNYGDPIYAADSGTVSVTNWYGGYGLQIVINHGNGTQTRYAHLQKIFVSSGQSISKGQTIAEMGSTGRSTGAHLHFEVIVNGRFTNPFNYL